MDFTEDEEIYNDLNLQDEEDMYGLGDNDHQSSLDAASVTEEHPPTPQKEESASKIKDPIAVTRRPSVAATRAVIQSSVAAPLPSSNGIPKPATQSARPATELKYASAVAATTNPASLLGIGPLPPPAPPPAAPPHRQPSVSSIVSSAGSLARATSPVAVNNTATQPPVPSTPIFPVHQKDKNVVLNGSPKSITSPMVAEAVPELLSQSVLQPQESASELSPLLQPEPSIASNVSINGETQFPEAAPSFEMSTSDEADIAMLPPGLRDLLHSFHTARSRAVASSASSAPLSTTGKMLEASRLCAPDALDSESKKRYTPQIPYTTPSYYPQLPHPTVTDPNFVRRCDVDTLFFMFYYQQETLQQYLELRRRLI